MAKKRGRSPKQTQTGSPSTINESIIIDFSKLDEIDLDSLPPEKALEFLEEIRGRLEGRVAPQEGGDGAQGDARDAASVASVGAVGAARGAVGALGPALYGASTTAELGASGVATGALAVSAGTGAAGVAVGDARGVVMAGSGATGIGAGARSVGAGYAAGDGPPMQ
ncbi:hypothetical protein RIF29_14075 [Crotalaria pallida]|uniref:Uncharacterized protein n=1 Tax=Crotalaria pallida TaxID=3830 RepID=A0AAN9FB34_CROPI